MSHTEYALLGHDPEEGQPFISEETFRDKADAEKLQDIIKPEYGATQIVSRTVTDWEVIE